MSYKVYLSLGSNMGDREKNLEDAIEAISGIENTSLARVSDIYETDPVGYTEQEKFLNVAVEVRTGLMPYELLSQLQRVENDLKRVRKIRWGPRTIDIDILLYEDLEINEEQLTIPHPRMWERAFVLIPLREIYPDVKLNDINIDELINKCSDKNGVRLYKTIDS